MENKNESVLTSNIKYGSRNYVEYHVGGRVSKIIICAPHGGNLKPSTIQNRYENCLGKKHAISVYNDRYTKELSLLLRDQLKRILSEDMSPHLIINNLHRTKMDANRDLFEATLNESEAVVAHQEYHGFIKEAKKSIHCGIIFDIHGQAHPEEWIELGYLIKKKDLCNDNLVPENSSIRSLGKRSNFSFKDIVSGSASLGRFLQDEGISVIPSPKIPKTKGNYFTGGFTTIHHSSFHGGSVDVIQIESHKKYRNNEALPEYVKALATAIKRFVDLHYEGVNEL